MGKIITHESPREFREVKQHEYLFRFFFDSMRTEMDNHHEQNKGNSWLVQDSVSTGHRSVTEMNEWLDILLLGMVDKYKETKDVGKLIHIANFCAMRTLRERLRGSEQRVNVDG